MRPKPIGVATDGTSASRGAVHIGRSLAEREDCPLHLIAVMKPPLVHAATSVKQLVHPFRIDPKQSEVLRMAVLAQVQGAEDATRVPAVIEIDVDTPAPAIIRQGCAAATEISLFHRAWLRSSPQGGPTRGSRTAASVSARQTLSSQAPRSPERRRRRRESPLFSLYPP
jgi:hypothetical protein